MGILRKGLSYPSGKGEVPRTCLTIGIGGRIEGLGSKRTGVKRSGLEVLRTGLSGGRKTGRWAQDETVKREVVVFS